MRVDQYTYTLPNDFTNSLSVKLRTGKLVDWQSSQPADKVSKVTFTAVLYSLTETETEIYIISLSEMEMEMFCKMETKYKRKSEHIKRNSN